MATVKPNYSLHSVLRFAISNVAILLLGYALAVDLTKYMDILMWDDMNYMLEGLKFPKINKTWGPLYGIWYKALSIFQPDPIKLYYLNAQVLVVLNAMLIYWMLIRLKFSEVLSFLLAISFLVSGINLETWPKISHFCMMFVSTTIIAISFVKANYLKHLICAAVALLLSFARSEFYLAFIIFLLIGGYQLIVHRERKAFYELPLLGILAVVAIFLHFKLGFPLNNGGRSTKAFAQHFALNYFSWNQIPLDWWLNWEALFKIQFGDASSFIQLLRNNPMMFFNHIGANLAAFITFGLYGIIDFLVPPKILSAVIWIRAVIAIVITATIIVFFRKKKQKSADIPFWPLFIFTIPAFIAVILIYPREHYLISLVPLVIVTIAYILNPVPLFNDQIRTASLIVLCVVLFFIRPVTAQYEYFNLWRPEQNQSNLKALEIVKEMTDKEEVNMLENEGGLCKLIGANCNWIFGAQKEGNFMTWMEEEKVNVIYVSRHLQSDPRFFKDEGWKKFMEDPENYGFKRVDLDGINQYLLVKNSL